MSTRSLVFSSGYYVPTLFRYVQKMLLACRECGTLSKTRYPLCSTVPVIWMYHIKLFAMYPFSLIYVIQ